MTTAIRQPAELFKHAGREYLVYEVAGHAEHAPTSIAVRLERHGEPGYSVSCTGSFTLGELKRIDSTAIEEAASDEEREMIRLFDGSPELQGFVRDWIDFCYHRYATADALQT
jgi:hypothetical protein